jgi:predicted phosphohydrolase
MKYIRVFSDIHLDWYAHGYTKVKYPIVDGRRMSEADYLWYPKPMPEDLDTCLVIPGDIWSDNQAFEERYKNPDTWLRRMSKRFKYIVFVLGNHDYWGLSLQRAPEKAALHGIPNVHFLEQSSVVLDQVKFLGGTLWTDYKGGDPHITTAIPQIMVADHTKITFGRDKNRRRLRVADLFEVHRQTKRYIANNAVRDTPEQKVVVVTHMAPSFQSVSPMYHTASDYIANFAYFSDLDKFVLQYQKNIDLWFHGHMHNPCDYTIGSVRVLNNPVGYMSETTGYDPWLRIDVDTLNVAKTQDLMPR